MKQFRFVVGSMVEVEANNYNEAAQLALEKFNKTTNIEVIQV